jgi:hypothetical protein
VERRIQRSFFDRENSTARLPNPVDDVVAMERFARERTEDEYVQGALQEVHASLSYALKCSGQQLGRMSDLGG